MYNVECYDFTKPDEDPFTNIITEHLPRIDEKIVIWDSSKKGTIKHYLVKEIETWYDLSDTGKYGEVRQVCMRLIEM